MTRNLRFSLALALAAALSASPVVAQKGNGNGNGNGKKHEQVHRSERRDRDDDRYERRDRDDRREVRRNGRDVPPGWCKGKGNPHNTPENCGYRSDRRYDDRRYEDRRSISDIILGRRSTSSTQRRTTTSSDRLRACRADVAERRMSRAETLRALAECNRRYGTR